MIAVESLVLVVLCRELDHRRYTSLHGVRSGIHPDRKTHSGDSQQVKREFLGTGYRYQ